MTTKPSQLTPFTFSKPQADELYSQLCTSRGVLTAQAIDELNQRYCVNSQELLQACLAIASRFAVAPISKFYVGAIAVGLNSSGDEQFYFGANLEFSHQALSMVVHAEQAAINNAWLNGAKKIVKIAITDAPCGHCRQFMNELASAANLEVLLPNRQFSLSELLPHSFGPNELGNHSCLLAETSYNARLQATCDDILREHAQLSYAPYTQNYSAVKILTYQGAEFYGRYIENAAYNPSLSPLQSAVSQLVLAGLSFNADTVRSVELIEVEGQQNQLDVVKAVLASLGQAKTPALHHHYAKLVK